MAITGILKTIADGAQKCAKTGLLMAKAHAPEIMIGGGIVGFGVTVYGACKATNKAHDILEEKEERVALYNDELDENASYTRSMYNEDIRVLNNRTRLRLLRAYAPVATTGIASVILVLGGYRVLNGRYIGVAAAYKTLEKVTERYRNNVIDEFGEETDWRMLHSIKKEDMDAAMKEREDNKEIIADNKNKVIKKRPASMYHDVYDSLFDAHSERWKRYWTPEMMLDYLRQKESEANDKLRINGSLFLNDVYEMLGMPKTPEGQVTGWIYNPGKFLSCVVDFGLKSMPEEEIRRILGTTRNEDLRVWLHFNPMGVVYTMI